MLRIGFMKASAMALFTAPVCSTFLSCASVSPERLADKAMAEGKFEEAEKIMEPVASLRSDGVYFTIRDLAEAYGPFKTIGHLKARPDAQKSLYWLLKVVNHPLHSELARRPGKEENEISGHYLKGEGTPVDLEKGCLWAEKAYRLGYDYGFRELADNCASRSSLAELRDPVTLQWAT